MTSASFRVTSLPPGFATRIRATLRDDFGRPVAITTAAGGEPMRDQLRRAQPGERLILCSYQAVPLPSLFAEIGPIYVSADLPPPAPPPPGTLPAGYFPRTLALRAYDAADAIVESAVVEPDAAPAKIMEFLAKDRVAHVHARFGGHGCFACRFDRA